MASAGADGYVAVSRRFRRIDEAPEASRIRRLMGVGPKNGWETLLADDKAPGHERNALVILAPSGAGKTRELESQAKRLSTSGVPVFHMSAVALATRGVAAAGQQFDSWKHTTHRAVFIIDAIDEARLEGHDFDATMARFAEDVDPQTKKLTVVLTSRNDLWSPDYERVLVRALALGGPSAISVLTMDPLTAEDAGAFARARGVQDVEAFVEAFQNDELEELLAPRPPDVVVLVEAWKRQGSFGSWSSMLSEYVETTIRDENRRHQQKQQFTLDEARQAVQRLAAATVLAKRPLISISRARSSDEVDAGQLFGDWQPAKLHQLLATGLFSHKGAHSVQLNQGPSSAFLAACWLSERVTKGWAVDVLEETLFVRPFGIERRRLPASRAGLVGWVAGGVPELRRRLVAELPYVALFDGDPSRLSSAEAAEALRGVVAMMRAGQPMRMPANGCLRQVAKQDLAALTCELLDGSAGCSDAQSLLLRLVALGRYTAAVPAAKRIASDAAGTTEARYYAVCAVAQVGTAAQRAALLPLSEDPVDQIRTAVLGSLLPDVLGGEPLVRLVVSLLKDNLAYEVAEHLTEVKLPDIDALLHALDEFINPARVVTQTGPALGLAVRLVTRRLTRFRGEETPAFLVQLLIRMEEALSPALYVPAEDVDGLQTSLARHTTARRAFFAAKVAGGARNRFGLARIIDPTLGKPSADDFEWLCELRSATAEGDVRNALGSVIRATYDRLDPEEQALRLAHVPDPDRVWPRDEAPATAIDHSDLRQRGAEEEARKLSQRRLDSIATLTPLREEIEAGAHERALIWAWQQLDGSSARNGRIGIGQLVEVVGDDLAQVFVNGFMRWWRRYDPPIPLPGANGTPYAILAGLSGLSFEIAAGLDLATLSVEDAARAARYALHELNRFPPWFDALRVAHQEPVRATLRLAAEAEWVATVEAHGTLSRAPYETPGTIGLVRGIAVDLLACGAPRHARNLHYALSALLQPGDRAEAIAETLRRHAVAADGGPEEMLAEWVRGWAHFAPLEAAGHLLDLFESSPVQFRALALSVAALLEADFDARAKPRPGASWTPAAFESWVRVLHLAAAPADDPDHLGIFTPDSRDRTIDFRRRCLALLARDPSEDAHRALLRLHDAPEMIEHVALVASLIESQLDLAAEVLATPWSEQHILAVERGDERAPSNATELFNLVVRRLAAVARLIENHEFSYANLFDEQTREVEVQRWVASSLLLLARCLYTVVREPELQDGKLVDISVEVAGLARIPLEIKPDGCTRYSQADLQSCVRDQLLGNYMRPVEVTHGILLIVKLVERQWLVDGTLVGFNGLVAAVRSYATALAAERGKQIAVVTIDIAGARG